VQEDFFSINQRETPLIKWIEKYDDWVDLLTIDPGEDKISDRSIVARFLASLDDRFQMDVKIARS
jgi:hypothetical protein